MYLVKEYGLINNNIDIIKTYYYKTKWHAFDKLVEILRNNFEAIPELKINDKVFDFYLKCFREGGYKNFVSVEKIVFED